MDQQSGAGEHGKRGRAAYAAAALMIWGAILYSLVAQGRPNPISLASRAAQACLQPAP